MIRSAAAAAVALAGAAMVAPPAAAAAERARASDALVDTYGINVHTWFPGAWLDWQKAIDAVKDIGVRWVRDVPWDPDKLNAMTAQTGAKIVVIVQGTPGSIDMSYFEQTMAKTRQLTGAAYLEGPNEWDGVEADWQTPLYRWHKAAYTAAKADPKLASLPFVAPSLSREHYAVVAPELGAYVDKGNSHAYTGSWRPSTWLGEEIRHSRHLSGDKGILFTETGYHNAVNDPDPNYPGLTERASGKYAPRQLFEHFNAGIEKSIAYELFDDIHEPTYSQRGTHFGIIRNDYTYKPAAVAMKNLIALLADPGDGFAPAELRYSASVPAGKDVRHTLLQKRDGSFWLALWHDVETFDRDAHTDVENPTVEVTLDFGMPVKAARQYLPGQGVAAVESTVPGANVNRLVVDVPDEVLLVEILPDYLTGDANGDFVVDRADLLIATRNWGEAGGWMNGDFDGNGRVGLGDVQLLELAFGNRLDLTAYAAGIGGASAVPEPGAAGAVVVVGAALALGRSSQRRRRR